MLQRDLDLYQHIYIYKLCIHTYTIYKPVISLSTPTENDRKSECVCVCACCFLGLDSSL